MATAATARGRKTRKTPTVSAARGPSNYFNSSIDYNSLDQLRVQRVIAVAGVSPVIATVIASLAFGGAV